MIERPTTGPGRTAKADPADQTTGGCRSAAGHTSIETIVMSGGATGLPPKPWRRGQRSVEHVIARHAGTSRRVCGPLKPSWREFHAALSSWGAFSTNSASYAIGERIWQVLWRRVVL